MAAAVRSEEFQAVAAPARAAKLEVILADAPSYSSEATPTGRVAEGGVRVLEVASKGDAVEVVVSRTSKLLPFSYGGVDCTFVKVAPSSLEHETGYLDFTQGRCVRGELP